MGGVGDPASRRVYVQYDPRGLTPPHITLSCDNIGSLTVSLLHSGRDAITPARTMEAVPWISSLNTQAVCLCFSRRPNAFELPKSSNFESERVLRVRVRVKCN